MDTHRLMRVILIGLTLCQFLSGCSIVKKVPVSTVEKVSVRDSIIVQHDTVRIEIPKEVVKEVVPSVDTSYLSTEVAESVAYLDTNVMQLHHELKNKVKQLKAPVETESKVITIEKEVEKEVPIEVPTPFIPTWCWVLIVFNGIYFSFKLGRLLKLI